MRSVSSRVPRRQAGTNAEQPRDMRGIYRAGRGESGRMEDDGSGLIVQDQRDHADAEVRHRLALYHQYLDGDR